MGLLDERQLAEALRSFSGLLGAAPGKAKELARGLLDYTEANNARPRAAFDAQNITLAGKPVTSADVDRAMMAASIAPLGITAWHGSPHKFEKFDMSKIGTGEGAQAYGHGLYMAESPDVAATYARDVTGQKIADKHGFQVSRDRNATANAVGYWKAMQNGSVTRDLDAAGRPVSDAEIARQISALQKELESIDSSLGAQSHLYKVDIPDEAVARFLDWDKPLSQQAPEVRDALSKIGITDAKNGEDLYWKLKRTKYGVRESMPGNPNASEAQAYASELMKQQGINGIRYLDGDSRSMGNGTSNYVLFDDQLPRILEVNGQATGMSPWKPGEWGGLLGR